MDTPLWATDVPAPPDSPRDSSPDETGDRPQWRPDVLPDGRDCEVLGEVADFAADWHHQGENAEGYGFTCGLCCCETFLRRHGLDVAEDDMVRHAIEAGLCTSDPEVPREMRGTTRIIDLITILGDHGLPAQAGRAESLQQLSGQLESGGLVMIMVNGGRLWNVDLPNTDRPDHVVVVTGIARSPGGGPILGCYLNDTGSPEGKARFVTAATMDKMWLGVGGDFVRADGPPAGRRRATR